MKLEAPNSRNLNEFVVNEKKKNQIEEYIEMLKIADLKKFFEKESKEIF